jgi:adenosylmethionine-8-amino-7-oxononanoate aminotransferase
MAPLPPGLNAHSRLVEEAYARGLIIYSRRTRGGTEGDHFMVCPPLIVTDAELDDIVGILTASLDAFADAAGLPRKP